MELFPISLHGTLSFLDLAKVTSLVVNLGQILSNDGSPIAVVKADALRLIKEKFLV
jgi:uncharacterized membrane protein YjjP (DUF1212 family)